MVGTGLPATSSHLLIRHVTFFLFVALIACPTGIHGDQSDEEQLWQDLVSKDVVLLNGTTWRWRGDKRIVLDRAVTIAGPGTLLLETDSPIVTGSGTAATLTVCNVTLFVSSTSSAGTALPMHAGPIPPINGSTISLSVINTTILASFGSLSSKATFWSSKEVQQGFQPVSVSSSQSISEAPQRLASYSASRILLSDVLFLPSDRKPAAVECYRGGWPVYDSESLRTALDDPAVNSVFAYQSFLLSYLDFSFWNPVNITGSRAVQLYGCPGTALDVNANWTRFSVHVSGGGSLAISGLTFANAPSNNQLFWPHQMPPLLGLVYVGVRGRCSLTSSTIILEQEIHKYNTNLTSYLNTFKSNASVTSTSVSGGGSGNNSSVSVGPIHSIVNASTVFISRWRLTGDALWPTSPGVATAAAAASEWDLVNVTVMYQLNECTSPYGAGIRIESGKRLQQLINDPLIRALHIVNDIQFVPSEWPAEVSSPNDGQLFVNGTKEIYACHSTPGQRYTIDFGDLGQLVFVFGTLRFRGSLLLTNPRASPRRAWMYLLVGALSVETDGVIEFEGVEIRSNSPSPFHNAADAYWAINCGALCPSFIPQRNSYVNASYFDAFLFDYKFQKTDWVAVSQGRNITGTGYWGYTDVALTWRPPPSPPPPPLPPPAPIDDKNKKVPVAAIAVPVAVGGSLLVAVIVGAIFWRRRRAAAAAAAACAKGSAELSTAPSAADPHVSGSQGGGRSSQEGSTPPQGSSGLAVTTTARTTGAAGINFNGISTATSMMTGSVPTEERIEVMRRVINKQSALTGTARNEQITLTELLGEGSFGKVYKGIWRGTTVAVKIMVLPNNMSGKEKREKMAVMETAISSSLSHPNIVQTFTYAVLPVKGDGAVDTEGKLTAGSSLTLESTASLATTTSPEMTNIHSWEVRLVLEFCDRGSLRDVLNEAVIAMMRPQRGAKAPAALPLTGRGSGTPGGAGAGAAGGGRGTEDADREDDCADAGGQRPAMGAEEEAGVLPGAGNGGIGGLGMAGACPLGFAEVLEVLLDVARAMLHMHSENIVHGDLKARNILLKSGGGGDGRKYLAKVADFGLSLQIEPHETHVSNVYQGTITHMAPEVLLHGKVSKMSDVYAFAILMWETYTAGQAFKGIPRALLGHEVTKLNRRPQFPYDTPFEFQLLACRCWESDLFIRPTFEQIVDDLMRMRNKLAAVASAGGGAGGFNGAPSLGMSSGLPPFSGAAGAGAGGGMWSAMQDSKAVTGSTMMVEAAGDGGQRYEGAGDGIWSPSGQTDGIMLPMMPARLVEPASITLESAGASSMFPNSNIGGQLFYVGGADGTATMTADAPLGSPPSAGLALGGRGAALGGAAGTPHVGRSSPAMPPILEGNLLPPH